MGKNLMKVFALILTAMLVISLAACGSGEAKTGDKTASEALDKQEQSTVPEATEKPKEPVTLTFMAGGAGQYAGGIQTDSVAKEIEKKLGISMDCDFAVTQEKYNAMLASGDLPDIIHVDIESGSTGYTYIEQLIKGNHLLDMDQYLESNGQDILKETPEKIKFSRQFYSLGQNKLYFLTGNDYGMKPNNVKSFIAEASGIGMWVRWDYYKELGYPEVKDDILDLIPILKQMQEKHPTTEDGKKVYAVAPWLADWNLWNFTVFHQGYINRFAEKEGFVDLDWKTHEVFTQIGDTNSSLWQGVKFYNKCKQAGILDPDSVTMKFSTYLEKVQAGRVLFSPVGWAANGFDKAAAQAGHPEQGFMPVKLPNKINTYTSGYYSPVNGRFLWAITKSCENPDRAMDFINYIMSYEGTRLLWNGVEGEQWSVVNGVPLRTAEASKAYKEDPNWSDKTGVQKYYNMLGRNGSVIDPKYNCPINYSYNQDLSVQTKESPIYTDYTQHYNVSYPGELFEKQLTGNIKSDNTHFAMVESTPAEIKQINDKLMNYLTSSMVKLVLAKDDAAFEAGQKKIIEDCKNMGYEQAFQWHKKAYDDAKAKYDAMMK